jgi:hypothetical protein
MTFEIVFRAEQALPAGLALSLGDGIITNNGIYKLTALPVAAVATW